MRKCGLCSDEVTARVMARRTVKLNAEKDVKETGKTYAICESEGEYLHVEFEYAIENNMSIVEVVSRLSITS